MPRPERLIIKDFADRPISFPDEAAYWRLLYGGLHEENALILGLGPKLPSHLTTHKKIFWLDSPKILAQTCITPPPDWQYIPAEKAYSEIAKNAAVYFYTPGLKADPGFWAPILARIQLLKTPLPLPSPRRSVWLPGHAGQLLHTELIFSLQKAGYAEIHTGMPDNPSLLSQIWDGHKPQLALSINFRGLDSQGLIYEACHTLGVPVAIWLVDNPWNLLSGIAFPWWKEAHIFVTDRSFLAPLQKAGAKNVHHLALGVPWHMRPRASAQWQDPPLFIGRSAFPEKKGYFAGLSLPPGHIAQAQKLNHGQLPDFHWWARHYNLPLWPGKAGRKVAYAAEECSRIKRTDWIKESLVNDLEIIGDMGWRDLLPAASVRPPVDYYGTLANYYNNASCILNITSLLLPESLNQRHFDVWAAGGFLLTDATAGLKIFPDDLTMPISLKTPAEFKTKLEYYNTHLSEKIELARAWKELLLKHHTYEDRIKYIVRCLQENNMP